MSWQKTARILAAGLVATSMAAACTAGGTSSSIALPGQRGGTLHLLGQADFEHYDPARIYVTPEEHLAVLYAPTLTSYVNAAGVDGTKIGADAATDTGRPNADFTQWSFTVRKNLTWQDGRPVTCADFKYGVERSFAAELTDGPLYQKQYLQGGDTYKGAYQQPAGLPSVSCAGDTITYKLRQPVPEFNYAVTLGIFAAVRKDKDTKQQYDQMPFSYGPYKFQQHVADKRVVLVRNQFWDQSQDRIRKNLPDRIDFELGLDASVIVDRLIADRDDDQRAIPFGNTQLTVQQAPQVFGSDDLKKRVVSGYDGFVYYIAINTAKVKDLKCRQAYEYAMNKQTYLTGLGGTRFGAYATTMVTPALAAYRRIDPYGSLTKPQGDAAKAKQLIAQSPTCPKSITFDYIKTPSGDRTAAAVKESFSAVGVNVKPNPIARNQYYATVGKPTVENELVYASWSPDWPSASTVIPPLFDGGQIVPSGNQNLAQLNDKSVNDAIAAAAKIRDPAAAQAAWAKIDEQVQGLAATIPLRYAKAVYLVGSKVTGARLHSQYSDISLLNVGVLP
ncbi:ABC transporter substrate-binding protein [Fodinicola acaciae]|uniref:ABC transporter substrate-binding protein n=1 Tax=Fodinicola acaciae TaxID=2681555 RepID=UPI0013D46A47|nr:ABC transporter substrate-binding protein [Fodinicola acaciae]